MNIHIPSLRVAATIEGVLDTSGGWMPKEETKERMKALGIQTLLDPQKSEHPSKILEVLETNVWKLASNVKKRSFGYKRKDFVKSLDFLEVFCMYCAQANFATQRNKKPVEEQADKNVLKAIKEIEEINKLLNADINKIGKKVLKKHIERLNLLVDKIFTQNLTQTEQIATAEIVDKAESILKKM